MCIRPLNYLDVMVIGDPNDLRSAWFSNKVTALRSSSVVTGCSSSRGYWVFLFPWLLSSPSCGHSVLWCCFKSKTCLSRLSFSCCSFRTSCCSSSILCCFVQISMSFSLSSTSFWDSTVLRWTLNASSWDCLDFWDYCIYTVTPMKFLCMEVLYHVHASECLL